jgi:hypothetical protein
MMQVLALRVDDRHRDYLGYLGLAQSEIDKLAVVLALPCNVAFGLVMFAFTSPVVALPLCVPLALAVAVLYSLASPALLRLGWRFAAVRRGGRKGRARRSSQQPYTGPYRAFWGKDLVELRTFNNIFGLAMILPFSVMVGLGSGFFDAAGGYVLCLYISLGLMVSCINMMMYEKEGVPGRMVFYLARLGLTPGSIVAYKLPLALAGVLVSALAIGAAFGVMYGITPVQVLVVLVLTLYFVAVTYAIGWVCVCRLARGGDCGNAFQILLMAMTFVPGMMLIYAVIVRRGLLRAMSRRGELVC